MLAAICFEGLMVHRLWFSEEVAFKDSKKQAAKPVKFDNVVVRQKKVAPLSAYVDITKANLFSVERQEFIPEVEETEPEAEPETQDDDAAVESLDTDKIVVYGVILMDGYQKALVSNPDKKDPKKNIWVSKGDALDKFKVAEIRNDRLILSKKSKKYSVLLYDAKKPKKRPVVAQKPKPRVKPKKTLKPTVGRKKGNTPDKPTKAEATDTSDDEYEVISTPFGDFKRKKKK